MENLALGWSWLIRDRDPNCVTGAKCATNKKAALSSIGICREIYNCQEAVFKLNTIQEIYECFSASHSNFTEANKEQIALQCLETPHFATDEQKLRIDRVTPKCIYGNCERANFGAGTLVFSATVKSVYARVFIKGNAA
uniref:DUF19 domain-containing protein n=1 Tax=Ascaris lumbricoides TaxID=6252 RepID=A0A0M3HWY3_ASCLU